MRPLIALLMAACLSFASAAAPQAPLQARESAVQVLQLVQDPETRAWSKDAICSGAVVDLADSGPSVVSAGHCVQPAPKARYYALDFKGRIWPLKLRAWTKAWPTQDYAVFSSLATIVLPALPVAQDACVIGDDVFSWSGPLGLGLMFYSGQYTGDLHFPTDALGEAALGGMMNTTLDVAGGASGSVVLNSRGEALAILVGGWVPTIKLHGAFLAPLPR